MKTNYLYVVRQQLSNTSSDITGRDRQFDATYLAEATACFLSNASSCDDRTILLCLQIQTSR